MFSDSVLTVANGEIFLRRIFLKIGNSRRNIKLLVTGYVINYLTAVCHMPNRKGGKWPRDFNAWANACCEFLNRRRPLMSREITSKTWWTWHVISSPKKTACSSQDSFAYNKSLQHPDPFVSLSKFCSLRGRPFNSWGEGWVISGHQEFFF